MVEVKKKPSLCNVLYEEVVRGSSINADNDTDYLLKEQRIITFLSIPKELEKVLFLGYLVCLDAFLFLFTFLPIRAVFAVVSIIRWVIARLLFFPDVQIDKGQLCDLFRAMMIFTCLGALSLVDISMLYHLIRGQSVIKLYFIYNLLEILDYLCCSFGNDVMDALFWITIRPKNKKREHLGTLYHWILGCIYTVIHSASFLIQAICLSVAINSHNKALLLVMTSNQYMELKSYLFKKFDKDNNFQIVARDIRERFSYTIVMIIVFLRNMSQLDWDTDHLLDIIPELSMIFISEVFIDWLKHAFVTKFNGIPIESYSDYQYQLYDDLLNPACFNQTFSNRMDLMARKILFISMPLGCLTIIVLYDVIPELNLDLQTKVLYACALCAILFIVKTINMGLILHQAERLRQPVYSPPRVPPISNVNVPRAKDPVTKPKLAPFTSNRDRFKSDPSSSTNTNEISSSSQPSTNPSSPIPSPRPMNSTPSPRASITPEELEPRHTPPRQYSPLRSPTKVNSMTDIIFEEEEDNEDEENNSPNFPAGNCIPIPNSNDNYGEGSIDNMNLDPGLRKRYVELSSSL